MIFSWLSILLHYWFGTKPLPPIPPLPPVPPDLTIDRQVLARFNQYRATRGLPPFIWLDCLANKSTLWAATMEHRGFLGHDGMETRLNACGAYDGGEIVDEGPATVEGAVLLWWNSPPHRAIMLGDFLYCGPGHSGVWWSALVSNGTSFGLAGSGAYVHPENPDPRETQEV